MYRSGHCRTQMASTYQRYRRRVSLVSVQTSRDMSCCAYFGSLSCVIKKRRSVCRTRFACLYVEQRPQIAAGVVTIGARFDDDGEQLDDDADS